MAIPSTPSWRREQWNLKSARNQKSIESYVLVKPHACSQSLFVVLLNTLPREDDTNHFQELRNIHMSVSIHFWSPLVLDACVFSSVIHSFGGVRLFNDARTTWLQLQESLCGYRQSAASPLDEQMRSDIQRPRIATPITNMIVGHNLD